VIGFSWLKIEMSNWILCIGIRIIILKVEQQFGDLLMVGAEENEVI
jgi:hypothetical protein